MIRLLPVFFAFSLTSSCFSQNSVLNQDVVIKKKGDLRLSPNPLSGNYLSLYFESDLKGIIEKVEVYDVLGKLVLASKNGRRLNVGELDMGIYIVRAYVSFEGRRDGQIEIFHKKLVIK